MIQKPIREFNGVPYTNAEADELTQELNDRTESAQTDYNSVDELATKVKGAETDINALEAGDYMYKGGLNGYDTNGNGKVDDSDKLGGLNPSYYDQQSQLDTHTSDSNIHLSTDERAAIDGTPNAPTAGNTFATQADIAASGNGDMLISVYGGSDGNTVDNADKLDGQLPSVYDQSAHAASSLNPHTVTKAQVGLGNVDNTTDADKPISTAAASKNGTQDSAISANASDITTNASDIGDIQTDAAYKANANTFTNVNTFKSLTTFGDAASAAQNVTQFVNVNGSAYVSIATNGDGSLTGENLALVATGANAVVSASSQSADIESSDGTAVVTKEYMKDNTAGSYLTGEPSGSSRVVNVVSLSQFDYDNGVKNATTFYIIDDA